MGKRYDKSLLIAGDLFPTPVNLELFKSGRVEELFGDKILSLFKNSAYSVCNLEGVFTLSDQQKMKVSGPILKTDPKAVLAYKELGVKCMATANNHVMDCLNDGYKDTRKVIYENGFDYVGSGYDCNDIKKYLSIIIGNKKICIYNVAETLYNRPTRTDPGVNIYDEYVVCDEIRKLKYIHDYLIVIYHGGTEFFPYPTPVVRKRFHRMADSGADLITSQHTHCLGCEEKYNGTYLIYGQGNFLFTRHQRHRGDGILIEIDFGVNEPNVILHHYIHSEVGVLYDFDNDLADFMKRSSLISNKDYVAQKYKEHVLKLYPKLANAFQSKTLIDRFLCSLLPVKYYRAYRKKFRMVYLNKNQIERIIYTLESDQQRETMLSLMYGLNGKTYADDC